MIKRNILLIILLAAMALSSIMAEGARDTAFSDEGTSSLSDFTPF